MSHLQCCGSHRLYADPDFHVEADPDPDLYCHRTVPILSQVLHMLENQNYLFSHSIPTLQRFIFLISVKCVICFQYFDSILKFSGKKATFLSFFICLGLIGSSAN
jgi:hypothetical protein